MIYILIFHYIYKYCFRLVVTVSLLCKAEWFFFRKGRKGHSNQYYASDFVYLYLRYFCCMLFGILYGVYCSILLYFAWRKSVSLIFPKFLEIIRPSNHLLNFCETKICFGRFCIFNFFFSIGSFYWDNLKPTICFDFSITWLSLFKNLIF